MSRQNFKIKVLITVLLVLTISLISTNSNAAFNFDKSFFTNLKTKITQNISEAITRGNEIFNKLKEAIDIKPERTENGIKLNLGFDYDNMGKLIDVDIDNDAVVEFDMSTMTLTVAGLGETIVNLKIGEKVIPIDVKVEPSGIMLKPQDTGVTLNGELMGNFKLNEKEIAKLDATVEGSAGIKEGGLVGNIEAVQNLTLLQRLKLKFAENANGRVDASGAAGSVSGAAGVGDSVAGYREAAGGVDKTGVAGQVTGGVVANGQNVAEGSAGIGYTFGAKDPVGSLSGSILGNKLLNLQNVTIPISKAISGLMLLFSGLR